MVCTGNICRSPMAEAMFNKMLCGYSGSAISAGLDAPPNIEPDTYALRSASALGFPIAPEKRSRRVALADLAQADLILGMTHSHLRQLGAQSSVTRGKVYLVGHWNNRQEVEDPIGGSEELFTKIAYEIRTGCELWVEQLLRAGLVSESKISLTAS